MPSEDPPSLSSAHFSFHPSSLGTRHGSQNSFVFQVQHGVSVWPPRHGHFFFFRSGYSPSLSILGGWPVIFLCSSLALLLPVPLSETGSPVPDPGIVAPPPAHTPDGAHLLCLLKTDYSSWVITVLCWALQVPLGWTWRYMGPPSAISWTDIWPEWSYQEMSKCARLTGR